MTDNIHEINKGLVFFSVEAWKQNYLMERLMGLDFISYFIVNLNCVQKSTTVLL